MIRSTSTSTKQQFAPLMHGGRRRLVTRPCVEIRAGFRPLVPLRYKARLSRWKPLSALNTDTSPPDPPPNPNPNPNSPFNTTRLGNLITSLASQLFAKLNSARKSFPTKIFLLLLGFYTANALATILGQTGDWDVLVAGVVVTAIEGIGMLMYKKPGGEMKSVRGEVGSLGGRVRKVVVMVNYWKAGVCLGLFVDAFKLGS